MRLDLHELFEKVEIPEHLEKKDKNMEINELSLKKKIDYKNKKLGFLWNKRIISVAASVLLVISIGILGKLVLFKGDSDNIDRRNMVKNEINKDDKLREGSDKGANDKSQIKKAEESRIKGEKDKTEKDKDIKEDEPRIRAQKSNKNISDRKTDSKGNQGIINRADNTSPSQNSNSQGIDIKEEQSVRNAESNGETSTEKEGHGKGEPSNEYDNSDNSSENSEIKDGLSIGSPELKPVQYDIANILLSNGWNIGEIVEERRVKLPNSFEYDPGLSDYEYFYAYMNNISKDSGYDYSSYAGQEVVEETFSVQWEGRSYSAIVLRNNNTEIIGLFAYDSNNILNSQSLYHRNITDILGENSFRWTQHYIGQ